MHAIVDAAFGGLAKPVEAAGVDWLVEKMPRTQIASTPAGMSAGAIVSGPGRAEQTAALGVGAASMFGSALALVTGNQQLAAAMAAGGQSVLNTPAARGEGYSGSATIPGAGPSSGGAAGSPISAQDYSASMGDLGDRIDDARSALGANCPRDLGYLDPVLTRYPDPELAQLRTAVVTTSVIEALAEYKSSFGATPYEAAVDLTRKIHEEQAGADQAVEIV